MDVRHSSTRAAAVVEIDDSDSDSDVEAHASRPKLRTRAAVAYAPSDDDDDDDDEEVDEMDDAAVDEDNDDVAEGDERVTAPPARASRKRVRTEDEDEDAYEPLSDTQTREEEEADDAEDVDEESVSEVEESGRRRSARERKPTIAFGGLDDDFVDPRFEYIAKPRRERNRGVRKVAPKQPTGRASKTNKKQQKKKKAKHSSDSDSDDEFLMSDNDASGGAAGASGGTLSDDENAFVIDKLVAREVHTLKEWSRICAQKTTRFLANMSIFLEDDDGDAKPTAGGANEEQKPASVSDEQTAAVVASESAAAESAVSGDASADGVAAAATETSDATDESKDTDGDAVMKDASETVVADTAGSSDNRAKMQQEPATPPAKPSSAAGRSASTPITISEVSQTEERFLVKWKGLSYLHVSWESEKALLSVDKNAKGKIQRFRDKELMGLFDGSLHGDEYFNPEFRLVDRILDIQDRPGDDFSPEDSDDESGEQKFRFFYVKWKALSYDALTWEREDDVDDDAAVAVYEDRLTRAAARHKRVAQTSSQKKSRKSKFRGYSATNPPPFREGNQFELRDYQLTGVNWMLFNWYQSRNSMLADEMGLGKTVQTVTFINHLSVVEELPGPYLIIAPLSTLAHWQREFLNWTYLDAVVYHGSATARKNLQEYEFFLTAEEYARADEYAAKRSGPTRTHKSLPTAPIVARSKRDNYRFDVLITTPEMCATADFSKLTRVKWQTLVVDEAHRLKNKSSKLSSLIHKNFKYDNILLLTGTPLQNNVEELWTLLNFLDRDRFDSIESFLERFGDLKDMSQVEQLHTELKPFLLRRMKEDVEKSLAPKEETIVEVELTVLQKQYYRAIYEQNTEFLSRGRKKVQTPSLMNVAMELRKCCNHPFLIKGVEEQEIIRLRQQNKQATATEDAMTQQIQELLVTSSGKLVLLDKLLPRLQANGHRVLIFSQFKIMLDILQDYLRLRAYHCERIDGNITGNDRQAAIDRYCTPDSASFIMLLSTRAGGVGINLTAADTVIIYDSDWNPQNDLQAQARCHRIGQKKSVKIYRLLTSKTYELHMFHQASLKLGLDQAVLGGIRSKDATGLLAGAAGGGNSSKAKANGPSKDEIENLLKHGAYEIFKEEKEGDAEAASKRFSEESIDQILNRSTKIVHDPNASGDADGKKSLMSSFSKATFVSSANPDEQVALDDPDFWTKVIGLQEVEEKPVEPSPLKKRRRRPVKSYLLDVDSDVETTSKRAAKKPKGMTQERDNEEYVISDDDDSDDDDDLDDLDDEEFGGAGSGKLRHKDKDKDVHAKPSTTPLLMYTERIAELLSAFGYGRWDDMVKQCKPLQAYDLHDLQLYTRQYIAHCVHVAAGTALANTTPQSNGELPEPLSGARKIMMIDNYADRFSFAALVLQDLGIKRMSAVALPKNLRLKPTSVKAQRDANARIQQIERMHWVQQIVRSSLGAPMPLVALVNDLQQLQDRERVQEVLNTGILPDTYAPVAAVSAASSSLEEEEEITASSPPHDAGASVADTTNATATELNNESKSDSAADVQDSEAAVSSPVPTASTAEDVALSTSRAVVDATTSGNRDKESALDADGDAFPVSSSGDAAVGQSSGAEVSEVTAPSSPITDSAVASEGVSAESAAAASLAAEAKFQLERTEALRRLRALPDIGFPDTVAPWWLSVLDDVILLFYVYKDGWLKGRTLPSQLVNQSSLFSSRAAKHPTTEWPTVSVLTKRVKAIISAWTNPRRLRLHMQSASSAPTALKAPLPVTSAASGEQSSELTTETHAGGHQSFHSSATPFSSAKHNRFAKIVFAFGIPDTSTCRDDHERLEKWRYFIQDDLLSVGRQPLVELLAEALDLERCCRQRTQNVTPTASVDPPHLVDSLLGGKRGFWQLTATQCRRLLQRVDLFRLLRTQILVLSPDQLIDVVGRVVTSLRADPSKNEFPRWWSSPRHDILLLQGVECYGLDEYLSHVWKLPLFAHANPTNSFPNTTWVENYANALALRCRRALEHPTTSSTSSSSSKRSRSSSSGAKRQSAAPVAPAPAAPAAPAAALTTHVGAEKSSKSARVSTPVVAVKRESEVRQRIRDIQGMRSEDPDFIPVVRQRQKRESVAAADVEEKKDERVVAASSEVVKMPRDDDEFDESVEATASASTSTSARAQATEDADSVKTTLERAKPHKTTRLSRSSRPSARSSPPKMRTRTRTPRAWDVIVIDESDDE